MPCLQDEDDLGELKHCALEHQLCMKGEMRKNESYKRTILRKIQLIQNWDQLFNAKSIIWTEFEGNTVDVRRCQLAAGKAGQCEKIHIMEIETEVCYCDTDGCNGTSNVLPQSFAVLLAISGLLLMLGFK